MELLELAGGELRGREIDGDDVSVGVFGNRRVSLLESGRDGGLIARVGRLGGDCTKRKTARVKAKSASVANELRELQRIAIAVFRLNEFIEPRYVFGRKVFRIPLDLGARRIGFVGLPNG